MKLGIIKSLFKTLKEPKNSKSVFLLRKHNKSQWRYNQALCYYLKTKASLDNMKRLNLVLPENVKKLGRWKIMYQKNWDLSKFLSVEREILTRVKREDQLTVIKEKGSYLRQLSGLVLNGSIALNVAVNLFLNY